MPGRRRKNYKSFRDAAKQGASHFEVGYRSQRDPMLADSEVSEHVLVPRESNTRESQWEEQMKYGIYYEDDYDYLQHLRDVEEIHDSEMKLLPSFQMKEEDDDVRSVSMASTTASRLTLPGSALGSTVERDVGLLNMAAAAAEPDEDWDPDIVAALDDNFDFDEPDNILDDEFMQMANAEGSPSSGDKDEDLNDELGKDDKERDQDDTKEDTESTDEEKKQAGESDEKAKDLTDWLQTVHLQGEVDKGDDADDDEGSEFGSDKVDIGEEDDGSDWTDCSQDTEGSAPKVSKYSASMLPRNENLQLLDRMTEALIKREYGWDKIGALDGEEMRGRVKFDSDLFQQGVRDWEKSNEKVTMKDLFNSEDRVRPMVPEKWKYVEVKDYSQEEEIDYSLEPLVVTKKPQYDCETIRSTYSRTKNLPTKIVFPEEWDTKKKKKKKLEESTDDAASESALPGLTLKDVEMQTRLERRADAPSTYRPKGETPEEKRERKQAAKEYQKERRAEKKQNKLAFQGEQQRQKKMKETAATQKKVMSFQS